MDRTQEGHRRALAADLAAMRAIADGDEAAFAALIDREGPRLLRFAASVLGTASDGEDVVQETLLALWENAASWQPDAPVATWLHTVCYRRCIDRLRARRAFVELDEAGDLKDERGDGPDTALLRRERALSLREAMAALPHRQRAAVVLFHVQELSQREAAAVMGVSEDAFESLLARGRRGIRAFLVAQSSGHGGDDD